MATTEETALLFIECQRGVVGDRSVLPALAEMAGPVLPTMGKLAAGARAAGVQVFHLTYTPVAGGRSTNRRSPLMRATKATMGWRPGDPETEVVDEIGVGPDDIVLPRATGISPVWRTETLTILRNMGIDEVVCAGVSTNWAIPLTVAAVADEDMTPVVPTDAVIGAPPEHHQSMMTHALGIVAKLTTTDALITSWGG
jgi:nicotinamidase-related amidase